MTTTKFIEGLPDLKQSEKDGDKWCIVYFSRQEDGYRNSINLDSGDALIVIQELIDKFGIEPDALAAMQRGGKAFYAEI